MTHDTHETDVIRRCPECGRVYGYVTDENEDDATIKSMDDPCARCEEGVENRDEVL